MGYTLRTDRWRYTEWFDTRARKVVAQELYDHQNTQTPDRNVVGDPQHKDLVTSLSEKLDSRGRAERMTTRDEKPAKR